MSIKMYAVFARETLALFQKSEGKLVAQAGHAYLHAWWDAEKRWDMYDDESKYGDAMYEYKWGNDARKIALVVDTIADLKWLYDTYKDKCGVTLTEDCGYTIFDQPTITCVGIGPIRDEDREDVLANLKSMRKELEACHKSLKNGHSGYAG